MQKQREKCYHARTDPRDDGAGNWDSTTIDGATQNRTHSASDQLLTLAGTTLTYDPRGNQLTDNRGNQYTWDLDNRIIEANGPGYQKIQYRYDALGRRIVRKQGTQKEVLLWWNNTEQSEHKHQAGQTTIQNDLQANPSEGALNTIFARALEGKKTDIQYYHKNYLDHVMAVSNANGYVIEHYRYTAFGEPEIYTPTGTKLTQTAIDNHILWNVRRYEPASGLYLYKYRDYDAITGRWPSRDPIEERGGVNLYTFAYNLPIRYFDLLGKNPFSPEYSPLVDFSGNSRSQERPHVKNDIDGDGVVGPPRYPGFPDSPTWEHPIADLFQNSAEKCCRSGKWNGSGSVYRIQFAFGWVAAYGKYICESDPIIADVGGSGQGPLGMAAFGVAAEVGVATTDFNKIEGVKFKSGLKGKIMLDLITTKLQFKVGYVSASGGIKLNNDETYELTGSAGLGVPKASDTLAGQFGNLGVGLSGGIDNNGKISVNDGFSSGLAIPFEFFNVTSVLINEVH
jgi:RHS repeat-associated protein